MKMHLLTVGAILAMSLASSAQDNPPQTSSLQVYANLVQVPVMAVIPSSPSIADLHFAVSLDSGPQFPTAKVRFEGNDPITLAILLDVSSGQQKNYDDAFSAAMATMAKEELRPADRVSIYSMDCQLVRTADNISADSEKLKHAVEEAVRAPEVHRHDKSRPDCFNSPLLWDSLAYIAGRLTAHPGRRVILAITDGHDGGSNRKLAELRDFVNMSAVAIFGFCVTPRSTATFAYQDIENAFPNLAQMSGGWAFTILRPELPAFFAATPRMFRRRYIVEFPRPDSLTAGPHSIVVTITDSKGIAVLPTNVRPAGLSLPIADPEVLKNPNTIPSDPAQAPTVGDRRILTQPH